MNVLEYLTYNLAIIGQFYAELFEGVVPRGALRVAFFAIATIVPALSQLRPRRLDILPDTLFCAALSAVVFVAVVTFENGPSPFLFLFFFGVFGTCLPFSLGAILVVRLLRRGHAPKVKAKAGGHHH